MSRLPSIAFGACAYATRRGLGVTSVFSLIVLGLAANWISVTESHLNIYYSYAALAVATAVLTFTVPVMYAFDFVLSILTLNLLILGWLLTC